MCPRARQIFPQTLWLKLTRLGTVTVDEPFSVLSCGGRVKYQRDRPLGGNSNSSLEQLAHTSCDDAGKWPLTEQQRFGVVSFLWPVIHTAKAGPSYLDALMPFQQMIKELRKTCGCRHTSNIETQQTWNPTKDALNQDKRASRHFVLAAALPMQTNIWVTAARGAFELTRISSETLLQ